MININIPQYNIPILRLYYSLGFALLYFIVFQKIVGQILSYLQEPFSLEIKYVLSLSRDNF